MNIGMTLFIELYLKQIDKVIQQLSNEDIDKMIEYSGYRVTYSEARQFFTDLFLNHYLEYKEDEAEKIEYVTRKNNKLI